VTRDRWKPLRASLSVAVLFSGASALILETLWFRQASLTLGSSVWASSLVLASFMAGLALGNGLAARRGNEIARPLVAYALLELLVAGTGVTLVFAWPALGMAPLFGTLVDVPLALNATRALVAFLLMLPPAAAMGTTLPLLARALGPLEASFGQLLGSLYGLNTLGAVVGAVAGEAFLVERLGIRGSALAAGGLDLLAATIALALSRRFDSSELPRNSTGAEASSPVPGRPLAAAFLCGAVLLALEVVWFRFLSMFVVGTSLTFSLMLAVVLLGIGFGGFVAAAWLRADPDAARSLRAVLFAAGALTVVCYAAFQGAGGLQGLAVAPGRVLGLGLRLMLPVSLLSGVAFTLLGHLSHGGPGAEARTVGRLTLANTLGAMAGSLAGGFLLLPLLGMERSLGLLAATYGVGALLVPSSPALTAAGRVARASALVLFAGSLGLFPFGLMHARYFPILGQRFGADGSRIAAIREGTSETLLYMRHDLATEPAVFRLITNGFSMSGTALGSRRYMSLYAWWPAAVHPDLRRALLISYGVGVTARSLTVLSGLERIDVVDVSRDVLELSGMAQPPGANPLDDPRVRVHVEDGRQYLLTSTGRYDLITGEPPPPHGAGVVNLYTREYFDLMRARLAPEGVVTYWLPVGQLLLPDTRAIVGAFCGAFPDCSLWAGAGFDWMLVGSNGLSGPVPEERFARPWRESRTRAAMAEVGLEMPEQLGALFIGDAVFLRELVGEALPLVDDYPRRIMSDAAQEPEAVPRAFYWRVMDAGAARERFRASALIAGLWPAALRERSLAYFEWQQQIDRGFLTRAFWQPPSTVGLPELDRVLSETPLRTLALWSGGTNATEQAVVRGLATRGERLEELLGLGALAARDYSGAADAFARAPGAANAYRRTYALALAGHMKEATTLAREIRARTEPPADQAFWAWMNTRFGLVSSPRSPSVHRP
jgi:predicted membrane-bound spermidine synthase